MSDASGPASRTRGVTTRASQTPRPETRTTGRTPGPGRPRKSRGVDDGLPEVSVGISHAYGSVGRVQIGSQVGSRDSGGFSSQFSSNRGVAVNRNGPMPVAPRRRSRAASVSSDLQESTQASHRSPRKPTRRPAVIDEEYQEEEVVEEEEEEEEEVEDGGLEDDEVMINNNVPPSDPPPTNRPDTRQSFTDINSTMDYGAPAEATERRKSPRKRTPTRDRPPVDEIIPTPAQKRLANMIPPFFGRSSGDLVPVMTAPDTTREHQPRYLTTMIREQWENAGPYVRGTIALMIPFFILMSLLYRFTNVPSLAGDLVKDITDGITSHIGSARNASLQKPMFDNLLRSRVDTLELDLKSLKSEWQSFQHSLPEQLLVRQNPETQALEIPPAIYTALQQKLSADYALKPGANTGAQVAWEKFVNSNQASIQSIIHSSSQKEIADAVKSETIISKRMFLDLLEEHTASLLSRVEAELTTVRASTDRTARDAAERIATEIAQRRAGRKRDEPKYLEDMLLLSMARRAEIAAQRNFFSPGLGAVVDPYLSSPSFVAEQPNLPARLWAGYSPFATVRRGRPPAVALQGWEEPGDCWCAARSGEGLAQIAVLLGQQVVVDSLVVEHITPTATLDIGAAPKEVEVWGLPSSEQLVDEAVVGGNAKQEVGCKSDEPELGKGWRCLGTGRYDLHGGNNVQVMPLSAERVLVDKVVVRAMSNWGGEKTCFYRLRLLGRDKVEIQHGG